MLYCIFIIIFIGLQNTLALTPLHKDAVIGGLKRLDHFRRGSLSGSLLILPYSTTVYDYDV